jgi:hypothetical protein
MQIYFLFSRISVESSPTVYRPTSVGLKKLEISFIFLGIGTGTVYEQVLEEPGMIVNHAFTKQAASSVHKRSTTGC